MNGNGMLDPYLARFRWAAVAAYVAVVSVFVMVACGAVSDIFARRADVAATADLLARLEGHRSALPGMRGPMTDAPAGSPFLQGPTRTIAGAALLQRVAGAVARVGGTVVSTQVELKGTQSKAGYISVTASCDLEQAALQKLLYDLEAGMPFLFVDQLVVQASTPALSGGRLRVVVAVSGQWEGAE